jgi:cyclase
MLRPRIIPCLLVKNGGLVKTVRFAEPKYVGDPINAVRIFNEKETDELIVADIDATSLSCEPDYKLIRDLAAECRMPLCYVGGVKTAEQVERIVGLGVEKVGLSSTAIARPALVSEAARRVGGQSVVVVLDVKKTASSAGYEVFTHNGTRASGVDPILFAKEAERLGAGEILVNSIDADGVMTGYDIGLIDRMREAVRIPLSILGGAGSLADIEGLIRRHGVIGAAAGSLFVFKGKFRAVLINYPSPTEKAKIFEAANQSGRQ